MACPRTLVQCILMLYVVMAVSSLRCHRCNEMITGGTVCKNTTIDDCEKKFPQQQSVCLKTVMRFSKRDNEPQWVVSECQIREIFEQSQIDNCTTADGGSLITCTCVEDLCDAFSTMALGTTWNQTDHQQGSSASVRPSTAQNRGSTFGSSIGSVRGSTVKPIQTPVTRDAHEVRISTVVGYKGSTPRSATPVGTEKTKSPSSSTSHGQSKKMLTTTPMFHGPTTGSTNRSPIEKPAPKRLDLTFNPL